MWKYVLVYNGEYDADEQEFATSLRACYEIASSYKTPIFVNVSTDCCEYVVVYDSSTMEESDWEELILEDGEGEYSA